MHTQVYFHHGRAISDNMLHRAMEVAVRDGTIEKDFLNLDNEGFLQNYLSLDDTRLFQKILSNPKSNAYKLMSDLENRNLMKRGCDLDLKNLNAILKGKIMRMKDKDFRKLEEDLAKECGCDKDFILTYLQKIENPLYKTSYDFFKAGKTPILIESKTGEIRELDKESPISGSQEPLQRFYVFCPEEHKDKMGELTKDISKIFQ